jgi:hypothetical protein
MLGVIRRIPLERNLRGEHRRKTIRTQPQQAASQLQAKEKGLRRNQTYQSLGLPALGL